MSPEAKFVLNGFRNLTDAQKQELIDQIDADLQGGIIKKGAREPMITLGPLKSGCPCCGR